MPFEVIRDRDISIPQFRDEPFRLGDTIPDEAFAVCPNRNLKRALLGLRRIREVTEPGAMNIDVPQVNDEAPWPRWHGGPWFVTPDGEKHRGKQKALAHMGAL